MRLALLGFALLLAGCASSPRYADCRQDPVWGCPSDYGPTHYEVCHHVNHGFGSCRTY
jgi:hypothetical protein